MKWAQISIYFYILGRLIFAVYADFSSTVWNDVYYIWDAAKDLLFVVAIQNLIPKSERWITKPVLIFCLLRLLWEIINPFTTVGINHPKAVDAAFLALITGVVILLTIDLIKRWKQK